MLHCESKPSDWMAEITQAAGRAAHRLRGAECDCAATLFDVLHPT
jgi:hypothetical protein